MQTINIIEIVLYLVFCYLLGSINTGLVISRFFLKDDIRQHGSGGAGTTNMLRTKGWKAGAITFAGDTLKGALAALGGVLLAHFLSAQQTPSFDHIFLSAFPYIAGLICIIGHSFPVFFSFKGGKGIATALGAFLVLNWRVALCALGLFIISVAITRIVSVGSLAAALSIAVLAWCFGHHWTQVVCCGLVAALLWFMHRGNIVRLVKGEEKPIFGKKKENDHA